MPNFNFSKVQFEPINRASQSGNNPASKTQSYTPDTPTPLRPNGAGPDEAGDIAIPRAGHI